MTRLELALLAGALTLASPRTAHADATEAKARYEEAMALLEQGRIGEACVRLEEAVSLAPEKIGVRLEAARCYEQVDKLASAHAAYEVAARLASQANDARVAEIKESLARVERRVGRLRLAWPNGKPVSLARVLVDGKETVGTAPALDAGPHRVVIEAPGRLAQSFEITIADGRETVLTLEPSETASSSAPSRPMLPEPVALRIPPDTPPEPPPTRTWPWITLGVGLASAAGAVASGVVWANTNAEYEEACRFGTNAAGEALCRPVDADTDTVFTEDELVEEGERLEDLRSAMAGLTIALGAAATGLGIATGIGFATDDASAKAVSILPWLTPQGAGLTGWVRF